MLSAKPQKFVGPIYLQVYDILKSDIINETWPVGRILPSEVDLAKVYGVSVGTMRKSLSLLVNEGLIVRQRGRGTVVADHNNLQRKQIAGKLVAEQDNSPITPISATTAIRGATPDEAKTLGIAPGSKVHEIVRSVFCPNAYRYVETITIPKNILPNLPASFSDTLDDEDASAIWDRSSHPIMASVVERILPTKANEELARKLEIEKGEMVLRVSRIAYDSEKQPLEYTVRYMHLINAEYAVRFDVN